MLLLMLFVFRRTTNILRAKKAIYPSQRLSFLQLHCLKNLSNSGILQNKDFSSRLIIDKRVYDRYDLSNINFSRWSIIRKLEWKEEYDLAVNEDLLVYEL